LTLAIHKMPFKCKIVALKDTNELYWFKRQNRRRTFSTIKR
jgi:hypothetical protein